MGVLVATLAAYDPDKGQKAVRVALDNLWMVLEILPPILVLVALLDVWVGKETMAALMGRSSGVKGLLIALALGSVAAGPLFIAFPIASMLARKGARYAYVVFFLGVWATTKLPVLLFELTFMGTTFTVLHVGVSLTLGLAGAFLIERFATEADVQRLATAGVTSP